MQSKAAFFAYSISILMMGMTGLAGLSGCGYSLKGTRNTLLEREKIRKIWVAPFINDSFSPGVENVVYNEVVKSLSAQRRVEVVSRVEDADAVLKGTVTQAAYTTSGATTADKLFGNKYLPDSRKGNSGVLAAVSYSSTLQCNLSLVRPVTKISETPAVVWAHNFSRAQTFPGNNQMDVFGSTQALINQSEHERALREMSRDMMVDFQEQLMAGF